MEAAQEGFGGAVVHRLDPGLVEGGENVMIDGVTRPSGVGDLGFAGFWRRLGEGLKGPERGGDFGLLLGGTGDGRFVAGIDGAVGNPCIERGDLVVAELALGRHLQITVGVGNGAGDEAGVGISGDNRRAGITAGFPTRTVIEAEAALDLVLRTVALVAVLDEKRADLALEVLDGL